MTTTKKSQPSSKIDPSQKHVLDLKGSEQHHDLKNQPGEKGDPNHTDTETEGSGEMEDLVEKTLTESEKDTSMTAALKKAVD